VGYNPATNDEYYPADLEAAQKKVREEYRADCAPAASTMNSQGASNKS
jgi:hypothetical protein